MKRTHWRTGKLYDRLRQQELRPPSQKSDWRRLLTQWPRRRRRRSEELSTIFHREARCTLRCYPLACRARSCTRSEWWNQDGFRVLSVSSGASDEPAMMSATLWSSRFPEAAIRSALCSQLRARPFRLPSSQLDLRSAQCRRGLELVIHGRFGAELLVQLPQPSPNPWLCCVAIIFPPA